MYSQDLTPKKVAMSKMLPPISSIMPQNTPSSSDAYKGTTPDKADSLLNQSALVRYEVSS